VRVLIIEFRLQGPRVATALAFFSGHRSRRDLSGFRLSGRRLLGGRARSDPLIDFRFVPSSGIWSDQDAWRELVIAD
jgi:hypothetical protein